MKKVPQHKEGPSKGPPKKAAVAPVVQNRTAVWPLVVLAVAAFLVYANALGNDFAYDDNVQVKKNVYITSFKYLNDIFTKNVWAFRGVEGISNYYRPMMTLTYLLDYQLFGLNPFGFHLTNILFHVLATVLVYLLGLRLLRSPLVAFVAALLFAVHPIHTESVTWIAGVTDVNCAVFFLAALILYIDAGAAAGRRRLWRSAFSLLAFFVALLCKEMALTLPLILIYYEHVYKDGKPVLWSVERVKRYAPYFAVVIVYALIRINVIGAFSIAHQKVPMSDAEFLLSVLSLTGQYGWKLLHPFHLQIWYNFKPTDSLLDPYVIGLLAFGLLLLYLARTKRWDANVQFCLFWIFVLLLPVMNIRGVGKNVFTERYLYIPSVGFCFLLSYLAAKLLNVVSLDRLRRPQTVAYLSLFSLLVLAYSYRTVTRNRDWKEDMVLFQKTLATVESFTIRNLMGVTYAEKGMLAEATAQFQRAVQLEDNYSAHNNLGTMYMKRGAIDPAIAEFQRAVQLRPRSLDSHYNLVVAYQAKGLLDPAIQELREILRLDPTNLRAHYDLGTLYLSQGQIDPAIAEYRTLLQKDPNQADAHNNLAVCYYQKGMTDAALREWETAVRLNPSHKDAVRNLAAFQHRNR